MAQSHSKFKVFISDPTDTGDLSPEVCVAVIRFVKENGLAPKSIGVEYLEHADKIVLSLGYRDDEPGYPVTLKTVQLGRLGLVEANIEAAMCAHADVAGNVICHEFYVNEKEDYVMVLLVQD